MGNNFFTIAGFIYNLLLFLIYFSKKRLRTFETIVYDFIVIVNLVTNISAILCYYTIKYKDLYPFLNNIVSKTLLFCYLLWIVLFTVYMVGVSKSKHGKVISKKHIIFTVIVMILIFGIIIILPLYYSNSSNAIYSYGPAANVVYLFSGLMVAIWLYIIANNITKLNEKKYFPLFIILIFGAFVIYIQQIRPELLLLTYMICFITFLMYFTIENPDVKMIEQLEVAKDSADKANRAKTDFLSSMSHEIRTPLNAISGFSDCIMNANTLDEAKENAKDIVDASNTLIEIVNGILDVSKIEAGKMDIVSSPYNTHEVFTELAKLITPRMNEKGLDFSYYIAPDIPKTLYGDHANIKKVVTNLLSNACKYTESGFVKYEVNCVNMKDYTRLIISVEDSGRGIKKQNIDKMFTKFQRLEEDRNTTIEGTGLGLAITKQLTELMGGKIIVHTIYGKGSKFTVVINQKLTDKEVDEEKEYKTTLDLHDVKMLIVDDTPLNIKVAKKILEGYNANLITTCESGTECIDIINKENNFDIILLDDMMPKMSGVETLHKLKEIPGFNTPTIALTANAITGMKEKYLSEGFNDYLAKPIEKNELIRVLNQALGRVVTEQIPVISDTESKDEIINDDDEKNINDIIPVEDNIEEILGKKLDLSDDVDTHFDNALVHVDHINDDIEILDDTKEIETIPVVDINIPTETLEKVDVNYLKENGVDIDHALELLGDMDMYNSTVSDFLSEIDDKWNRIVEYKNKSDMENYAIEVHSLKSDSKYLGLMKLSDIAYQHELKSKENNIEYVNEHFNELEDEYKKDLEVIKKYSKNN